MASAARFHAHVRTGLLERAMSLGADHVSGPHRARPEVARRFVSHVEALAEAGLCAEEIFAFAAERDIEDAGVPWAIAILFGCVDAPSAEVCFEAWAGALDPSAPTAYAAVIEIARALAEAPSPRFNGIARRLVASPNAVLRAIALECSSPGDVTDAELSTCASIDAPMVWTALDRLLSRGPRDRARHVRARPPWTELGSVELAFEAARARVLCGDLGPLYALRARDSRALSALGPRALDCIALACDPADPELPAAIARATPTTPQMLSALGRIGLPALFPRLLAALDEEDFEDDAHEALVTALGPVVEEPSPQAWQEAVLAASSTPQDARRRAGAIYSSRAVLADLKRSELSALDVEARANELFASTGRHIDVSWNVFGTSLEAALVELSSLVR